MTTKTLEQLQAEAEAANAALQKAKEIEQLARYESEQAKKRATIEEERRRGLAMDQGVLRQLMAQLDLCNVPYTVAKDVTYGDFIHSLTVVGASEKDRIGILYMEATYTRSTYHSSRQPSGKVLVLKEYSLDGQQHRYPYRSDGTYNVEKAAKAAKALRDSALVAAARQRAELAALQSADALAKEVCKRTDSDIVVGRYDVWLPTVRGRSDRREYTAKPGHVFVRAGNVQCTPEQAEQLVTLLKSFNRSGK